MENLEEFKKEYRELVDKFNAEADELFKKVKELEKKEIGRWRAEEREEYWIIEGGNLYNWMETNGSNDDFRYKTRNYFKTGEEAEKHLEKINTYYELMDLAEELNNGEEIDWENSVQNKYYIIFVDNGLYLDWWCKKKILGNIYCLNENFLEIAKERIGEERLIKLFKE